MNGKESVGEMSEWLKVSVLKTDVIYYRGFESHFLRECSLNYWRSFKQTSLSDLTPKNDLLFLLTQKSLELGIFWFLRRCSLWQVSSDQDRR